MQNQPDVHYVLIELDALLDTRIATVAKLYPDKAHQMLHPAYRERHTDEFHLLVEGFDQAAYEKAYAERNVETLMSARPTDMVVHFHDMLENLQHHVDSGSPIIRKVTVQINMWPYDQGENGLTEEEKAEIMISIRELCRIYLPMEVVSVPYERLTEEFMRVGHYSLIVLYNYREWFTEAHKGLTEHPQGAPGVTMIAPALAVKIDDLKDDKIFELPNGYTLDQYDATSMLLAQLVGIHFLPPEAFSLIDPARCEDPSVP